jgi:DNA mismatch repair ATPase MutS
MNLDGRLMALGVSTVFPGALPPVERALGASGLCDVSLALGLGTNVVPNDLAADGKSVCVITGANQGGKTCFLRATGLAQLMMHAGLFVAAKSFAAAAATGVFTHFRREEDASMRSGRLDEELGRMSAIADYLAPNSLVLFNESFAATNEREGSEIARQVVTALLERRVRMALVTHLYTFAHGLVEGQARSSVFLRSERRENGARTFKLVEAEPLETSCGEDVYRDVFGSDEAVAKKGAQPASSFVAPA